MSTPAEHLRSLFTLLRHTEDLLGGGKPSSQDDPPAEYQQRVQALSAKVFTTPEASRERPSPGPEGAPPTAAEIDRYRDLSADDRYTRLHALSERIRTCDACPLSLGRHAAVPGEGVIDPLVMIVGEGPGYHEDQEGTPFVGRAGQYLDKWLEAIGLQRDTNVFIANIVKCRPPNNRDPKPEEIARCSPYLEEQIALVRPRLILTLGRISMRMLTGATQGITRIHGTIFKYHGIPLVPTFHPSAVLRNDSYRRPVWEDLKTVRNWLIDNAGHSLGDGDE